MSPDYGFQKSFIVSKSALEQTEDEQRKVVAKRKKVKVSKKPTLDRSEKTRHFLKQNKDTVLG